MDEDCLIILEKNNKKPDTNCLNLIDEECIIENEMNKNFNTETLMSDDDDFTEELSEIHYSEIDKTFQKFKDSELAKKDEDSIFLTDDEDDNLINIQVGDLTLNFPKKSNVQINLFIDGNKNNSKSTLEINKKNVKDLLNLNKNQDLVKFKNSDKLIDKKKATQLVNKSNLQISNLKHAFNDQHVDFHNQNLKKQNTLSKLRSSCSSYTRSVFDMKKKLKSDNTNGKKNEIISKKSNNIIKNHQINSNVNPQNSENNSNLNSKPTNLNLSKQPHLINKNYERISHFNINKENEKNKSFPNVKTDIKVTHNEEQVMPSTSKGFNLQEILDNPSVFNEKIFEKSVSKRKNENICEKNKKPKLIESYAQKSNVCRFIQSSYSITDVINKKRMHHKNNENKDEKLDNKEKDVLKANYVYENDSTNLIKKIGEKENKEKKSSNSEHELNNNQFLNQILNWKTSWIKEFSSNKTTPELCIEKLQDLKLSYSSIEEYFKIYKPLILNEIWFQIMECYDSKRNNDQKHCSIHLNSYEEQDNFLLIYAHSAITKDDFLKNNYITEGDLLMIEIQITNDNQNSNLVVFGYVNDCSIEEIKVKNNLLLNKFPKDCRKFLTYCIKLKKMKIRLNTENLIRCRSVFYLKPMLRQCEAICNLSKAALCEEILKPSFETLNCTYYENNPDLKNFNPIQQKAISTLINIIKKPADSKNLVFIQGPPGTGKTHTLIGIIKNIYLSWDKEKFPKLLICAPSNGAIDEIGKRLYYNKNFLKSKANRSLRIVRTGQEVNVNSEIKKYIFLENLVESNLKNKDDADLYEEKINKLDIKACSLRQMSKLDELKEVEQEIFELNKKLCYLRKQQKNIDLESEKKKLRMDLLSKADVILTTLNSCQNNLLSQIFSTFNSFNCCIVDEASQCSEPEILMPLFYPSINKFFLIGDPMQLPATVISHKAAEYQYGRSLFERHFNYFKTKGNGNLEKSPIIILETQYRMKEEICKFPSKKFYFNKLKTDKSIVKRLFPLRPYLVFNVKNTVEESHNKRNILNELECNFVLKLTDICTDIIQHSDFHNSKTVKIGLITPYQGQKRLLENNLVNRSLKNKIEIKINTIDGFQGQEMDIIIISAVRAFETNNKTHNVGFLSSIQRLNVALTRAKSSLFICLSAHSLKTNKLWNDLIEDAKTRSLLVDVDLNTQKNLIEQMIKETAGRKQK